MQNRKTSRSRPAAMAGHQGNTIPVQGEKQQKVARLPHERDESADQQAQAEPSVKTVGAQALRDVERGLVDTDKGPVLDAVYDKVREGTPAPAKKRLG